MLEKLRQRSDTLEDFLKLVAGFGSHQEFLDYLEGVRGMSLPGPDMLAP